MQNEIVVYGKGYTLNDGIKTIVSSAKKINANITVISDNLDYSVVNYVEDNGGKIFSVDNFSPFNVTTSLSPYTLKVIYFYLYTKNFSKSENVYLCDFTDIYLQENLFELIKNDKPYVTSENKKIKDCDVNTTWINICYDRDMFQQIKDNDIINGGNIFGKRESCIKLLKEMCIDMQQIISRVGNYANIDQASLTKTVHTNHELDFNILDNYEVANLAPCSLEEIDFEDDIIVKGIKPYVIHQYDIFDKLKTFIYKK